mmetsp:Transcript_27954/g.59390  ORF Transcript_27954/g.59390 Transcript_27954/m.59390 type:complete len:220 (-) Transcript_27954:545-1204(-)
MAEESAFKRRRTAGGVTTTNSRPGDDASLDIEPINVDIGGQLFRVSKTTLVENSSYFESLLSERWKFDEKDDDENAVFVDQDPKAFEVLLNYMRSGMFPEHMADWFQNEQGKDPFVPASPMDAQDIADLMQCYWNQHYKKMKKEDGSNKNKRKNDDRDDDGKDKSNDRGNKKRWGNNSGRDKGNQQGRNDRNNNEENCPIKGHEKYHHNWLGCFLNPYS